VAIEEQVFSVLSGSAAVTALCPAVRILPEGVYQGLARPYIRHFSVDIDPIHTHQGMATLKNWPYQVSIFADDVATLTALRSAVIAALDASTYPRFNLTGAPRIENMESTDTPTVGVALLLEAWYE